MAKHKQNGDVYCYVCLICTCVVLFFCMSNAYMYVAHDLSMGLSKATRGVGTA